MIKLSFIMPFYNGADTVIRALDSIYQLSLPMEEYEVIVIDDCSPQPADDVLAEYKGSHPNLRVIRHTQNTRQGGAKNTGMAAAKGAYIAFIDQDDRINPQNMSLAINMALETNVDVVSCHYSIQEDDGSLREVGVPYPKEPIVSGVTFCEGYYDCHESIGPWSYIYKTEYIRQLNRPMKEKVILEDPDWTIWHLIHAQTMAFLPFPIYVWVMNPTSVTHSTHRYINRADWIRAGLRKIEDAEKYRELSPSFADKIIVDGRWNVEGGFRKLWKVNNYKALYHYLGDSLYKLQGLNWHGITSLYINHPRLSLVLLYIFGTPLKRVYYVRNKVRK